MAFGIGFERDDLQQHRKTYRHARYQSECCESWRLLQVPFSFSPATISKVYEDMMISEVQKGEVNPKIPSTSSRKKSFIHVGMMEGWSIGSLVIHTSNGYLAITQVPFRDRGTHLEKFRERIQSPLGTEMHWTCDTLILSESVELAYKITIWKGTFPLCFVEVTFT